MENYHIEGGPIEEYAVLDRQIKELKARQDEVRGEILKGMQQSEQFTIKSYFGTFTVAQRITYAYSKKTQTLGKKVEEYETKYKEAKRQEEESGVATVAEVKEHLMFRAVNHE